MLTCTIIFFFNFFKKIFCLHRVFVAARGLSLVAGSGVYSSLWCSVFSLWWLLLLQSTGSRRMGFSSCSTQPQQLQHTGPRARGLQQLWRDGSVVVAHGLSCSVACGIFPDQGSNPCPLQWQVDFFSFINLFIFIYLFLAALGLRCCMRAFSSCSEQGLLFVVVHVLLIAVASLVVEHRLQAHGLHQLWHVSSVVMAHELQSTGSVVVVHRLSCSTACGIFPDQGSNPCSLRWQVDS